ncbi:hypothetical protein [Tautonia marina]|uniref:hypothetical protein n=1 Tax=Tautonia marina TaxID=2653855 RepID=UPI001260DBC9|nr:hypothetical protein [Tautonia marina]
MAIDNPYEAPRAELAAPPPAEGKTYGGIGRGLYLGLGFLSWVALGVLLEGLSVAWPEVYDQGSLIIMAAQIAGMICLSGLRIRNMGQSFWWGLALIVPVYGLIVLIRCLAYPEGWSDHRTLDTPGKIIGSLIAAVIILPLVLIIVFTILA